MEYRRVYIPGGTYFFTVVSYHRQPIFSNPNSITLLRNAFQYTQKRLPFTIVASIILPDHMHFIWTLPQNDSNFSTRWYFIKSHFTRNWRKNNQNKASNVWQKRFWEHYIRDEQDLHNHIDYIHYNPVKHGLVALPANWQYSSFSKYVKEGLYPSDWGGSDIELPGNKWIE